MIDDITTPELLSESLQNILLRIPPSAIFTLTGHPGAGKTTLVQRAAALLSVDEPVQSPTFNLMHIYNGYYFDGTAINIFHLDCYRLSEMDNLPDLHFMEFSENIPYYAFVEWPEKIDFKKLNTDIAVYALAIDTKWNRKEQKITNRILKYTF